MATHNNRKISHGVNISNANPQVHLLQARAGVVVKINKDFLLAAFFGWLAWTLWTMESEFYGVTLLASMFALVAVGTVIAAFVQIGRLYQRERMVAAYVSQGAKPKTSELASDDALDKAGMR